MGEAGAGQAQSVSNSALIADLQTSPILTKLILFPGFLNNNVLCLKGHILAYLVLIFPPDYYSGFLVELFGALR